MTARIVHVTVHGRVQGVGYRAWVRDHAERNALQGWVRNRRDGTVEAVFSGPNHRVEAVLEACLQGPAGSVVERVEILRDEGATIERQASGRFEIRGTA